MDRYVSANSNRASLWGGKKKKKKRKRKRKEKNKRHSAGGRNGGTLQSFCRGGGVLANLDFCEVGPWGGERGKVKSGGIE